MSAGRKSFVLFKTIQKKNPRRLGTTLLRPLHLKRDSVGYSTHMLRKSKKIGWGGGSLGPIKAAHAAALCQKLLTSQRGRAAAAKVAGPLDETGVGGSLFERRPDGEDFSSGMWLIHQEKRCRGISIFCGFPEPISFPYGLWEVPLG